MKPRPEVLAFAQLMEAKLRKNDHKGGWQDCSLAWLLERLGQEVAELVDEIGAGVSLRRVADEAADIANFCMMITDVCGELDVPWDHSQ